VDVRHRVNVGFAFNSLYEIHITTQILYSSTFINTFNSLYEIPRVFLALFPILGGFCI